MTLELGPGGWVGLARPEDRGRPRSVKGPGLSGGQPSSSQIEQRIHEG